MTANSEWYLICNKFFDHTGRLCNVGTGLDRLVESKCMRERKGDVNKGKEGVHHELKPNIKSRKSYACKSNKETKDK